MNNASELIWNQLTSRFGMSNRVWTIGEKTDNSTYRYALNNTMDTVYDRMRSLYNRHSELEHYTHAQIRENRRREINNIFITKRNQ